VGDVPQLLSRLDDNSWLTPSIAEILKQTTAPPVPDDTIRGLAAELIQKLNELGTPVRMVEVRPSLSHILYVARPDAVGRLGSRRVVTPNEIRQSVKKISEERNDWTLGFMTLAQDTIDLVGIMLRTEQHQPLNLRQLVLSNTFRDQPSTLTIPLGVNFDKQIIVRDLIERGHLLLIGSENPKRHFLRCLLLTAILFNTPTEVRLAIAGNSANAYSALTETPHALGRVVAAPEDGQRLLNGLVKELQRRQQRFQEKNAATFDDFKTLLREQNEQQLPRIILVIDSLSDPQWREASDEWRHSLYELLSNGARVGIHLVLVAEQFKSPDVPDMLQPLLPLRVVMRASAAATLAGDIKNFRSMLRFVDAFLVDRNQGGNEPVPLELCAVPEDEVQSAVQYWKQAARQRSQEVPPAQARPAATGLTGYLRIPNEAPTATTGQSAAQTRTVPEVAAFSAVENTDVLQQAQALAAYLGWLGAGPLKDVLGLSIDQARAVINRLKSAGVLEESTTPTARFIRLAENPLTSSQDGNAGS
jgi:hypothetical protein